MMKLFTIGVALAAVPSSIPEVRSKLCEIMDWLFVFALAIGVICILIAAFTYVTSSGNAEKVGVANKAVMFAIVGIVVAFLAGSVPGIVGSILGSDSALSCSQGR